MVTARVRNDKPLVQATSNSIRDANTQAGDKQNIKDQSKVLEMLKKTLSIKKTGADQETSFSLPNSPKFVLKRENKIPSFSRKNSILNST